MSNDKNVLLTGASRGLGLGIAKRLLSEGWTVYACSRTEPDELKELSSGSGGRLRFRQADLSDPKGVKSALFSDFLPLDVPLHGFVNNAAMAYDDLITNLNVDRLEQMYRVNVFSPMSIVKHAIRNMIYHGCAGSIVHISSVSVHTGYKGLAMYASTKGALEAFSRNTAREWGPRGVRSNAISAGFMETTMTDVLSDELRNRIYRRTSLGRATEIESVAAMVAFLLSDDAQSITGATHAVDSGTI
jgi:3-oxoacyl-[acyl-carrier protein] reductase